MTNNINKQLQDLLDQPISVTVERQTIFDALQEIKRLQKILKIHRKHLSCSDYD